MRAQAEGGGALQSQGWACDQLLPPESSAFNMQAEPEPAGPFQAPGVPIFEPLKENSLGALLPSERRRGNSGKAPE